MLRRHSARSDQIMGRSAKPATDLPANPKIAGWDAGRPYPSLTGTVRPPPRTVSPWTGGSPARRKSRSHRWSAIEQSSRVQPSATLTTSGVGRRQALARGPAGSAVGRARTLAAARAAGQLSPRRPARLHPGDRGCSRVADPCHCCSPTPNRRCSTSPQRGTNGRRPRATAVPHRDGCTERALASEACRVRPLSPGSPTLGGNAIAMDDVGADPQSLLAFIPLLEPDVIRSSISA